MSTSKAPVAGTPQAWMVHEIQARDLALKAEIGSRNEEFFERTVHGMDQDGLFGDEFEARLGGMSEAQDGRWDSMREDLDFFRRENSLERD